MGQPYFTVKDEININCFTIQLLLQCAVFTVGKEGDIHTGNFVLKTFSKEPKRLTSKGKKKKTDVERRTRVGQ